MSIYGGFGLREQESKYNITLFDFVLSLSARVYGTLKNRTAEQLTENKAEFKFLAHLTKLHRRMQVMEEHKRLKPFFSQAGDRLNDRITKLIGEAWEIQDEKQAANQGKIAIAGVDGESYEDGITNGRVTPTREDGSNQRRAVTLDASYSRRSRSPPHQAYVHPPKTRGFKPVKTHHQSAIRSKKSPNARLNQDLSASRTSLPESQKSYKNRNELIMRNNPSNRNFETSSNRHSAQRHPAQQHHEQHAKTTNHSGEEMAPYQRPSHLSNSVNFKEQNQASREKIGQPTADGPQIDVSPRTGNKKRLNTSQAGTRTAASKTAAAYGGGSKTRAESRVSSGVNTQQLMSDTYKQQRGRKAQQQMRNEAKLVRDPKFRSGEQSLTRKPQQQNVTHNNIINVDNMIINYNNNSTEKQPRTEDPAQTSESNMPIGILSSPPCDSNIMTEQSNAPQAYGNMAPSSTKNANSEMAAQILAIANDSSFAVSSSNRGGIKTMNTTQNNKAPAGQAGIVDEEIMFIGRKVQKNSYSKKVRARVGQSLNNPSFNAKGKMAGFDSAQDSYKIVDDRGNLKLSFSKKRSLKKPQTGYSKGRNHNFLNDEKSDSKLHEKNRLQQLASIRLNSNYTTTENGSSMGANRAFNSEAIGSEMGRPVSREDPLSMTNKTGAITVPAVQTNRTEEIGRPMLPIGAVNKFIGGPSLRAQQQQQRMHIKRDVMTAAAAMRAGYSGNRQSLLSSGHQQYGSVAGAGEGGRTQAHSLEPGFRIYGKNQAAREFVDMKKAQQRNKLRSKVIADPLATGNGGDFSFRARPGEAQSSPRGDTTLNTRSQTRQAYQHQPQRQINSDMDGFHTQAKQNKFVTRQPY